MLVQSLHRVDVENDKYLLFNKIIENDLFNKNDIYNYKYIKYKTKYNNLKMLLQK